MNGRRVDNVYSKMPDREVHGNIESNIEFLRRVGVMESKSRMLEIGSGKGALLHYLTAHGLDSDGVDINEEYVNIARTKGSNIRITLIEGTRLPFESEAFDIVMSFDVLEHIPDTDAHLLS